MISVSDFTKPAQNIFYSSKLIFILALLLLLIFSLLSISKKQEKVTLQINNHQIQVRVADTPHEHSMGLSYTKELKQNTGMLFVFDTLDKKTFWMRDMLFDIDIVWIDENKKVLGFFKNVSKESYNREIPERSDLFHSPINTKYVLELNSGDIERLGISIGDKLVFDL